jgi:hypothetical protein
MWIVMRCWVSRLADAAWRGGGLSSAATTSTVWRLIGTDSDSTRVGGLRSDWGAPSGDLTIGGKGARHSHAHSDSTYGAELSWSQASSCACCFSCWPRRHGTQPRSRTPTPASHSCRPELLELAHGEHILLSVAPALCDIPERHLGGQPRCHPQAGLPAWRGGVALQRNRPWAAAVGWRLSEGAGNESAQAAAIPALAPAHSFPAFLDKRMHGHPIGNALESRGGAAGRLERQPGAGTGGSLALILTPPHLAE